MLIKKQPNLKVVVDGVNSSGDYNPEIIGINGVEVVKLYCEPTGHFSP
jgi:phosphomannomutase